MAVDKIFPRRMEKDKSPLYFEEGDIIDAVNASIAEYNGSNGGTYKPIKGTTAVQAITGGALVSNAKVIGSVADPSRNRIYFFVKFVGNANSTNQGVYYMDGNSENRIVQKVLTGSIFNLSQIDFVKADVVNADFDQNGSVSSMIYFTDGVNEPRRLNIDRAIAGQYATYNQSDLGIMLSVCKAAPINVPKFTFQTDSSFAANSLHGNAFQFAVQYIYEDGEESAISGYSRIAYTEYTASETVDKAATSISRDNVCIVDISRINSTPFPAPQSLINGNSTLFPIATVTKIRLLARNGNSGSLSIIDEFDPDNDLERHIFGVKTTVYNKFTKKYRFYNDGLYTPMSQDDTNKLFDNVPFTAVGQCIAENRLMYSNYKEGRDNVDVSKATITVSYSNEPSAGTLNVPSETPLVAYRSSVASGPLAYETIKIDLEEVGGFSSGAPPTISAGSTTELSFLFKPQASVSYSTWESDPFFYYDVRDVNGNEFKVVMNANPTWTFPSFDGSGLPSQIVPISISVYSEVDMTVAELTTRIKDQLIGKKVQIRSRVPDTAQFKILDPNNVYQTQTVLTRGLTSDGSSIYQDELDVEWSFEESTFASDLGDPTSFRVIPYISKITPVTNVSNKIRLINISNQSIVANVDIIGSFSKVNLTQQYMSGTNPYTFTINGGQYSNPNDFVYENKFSCISLGSTQSFKAGATHDIGVVYYDKYNRCGNVNIIGSFYSLPFGHLERNGKNGATSITVNFGTSSTSSNYVQPPSWASRYQLVYSGPSTHESFTSYTTGGGYVKRDSATNDIDTDSKRIYVSLKTLEKYTSERSSHRAYSFTPGDKLRVIKYGDENPTYADVQEYINGSWTGTDAIMEFNVVGFEVLTAANNPIKGNASTFLDQYYGDFVILEAPETTNSPPTKKYLGFDWHQITGTAYANGNTVSPVNNLWGKRSLVEIYTPKKQTSEKVYYEIGDSYEFQQRINNGVISSVWHEAAITNQGDVHLRVTPCKTPLKANNEWNISETSKWGYAELAVESNDISDIKNLKSWSRGRPHVRYELSKTRSEYNGLIYGDAYEQDVQKNSLSSFNPSLGNFHYFDRTYGAANYIASFGENLISLQENKVGVSGLSRNIISYADGGESVTVSTNVISQTRYLAGDVGVGNQQKGVLKLNNNLFFYDPIRRKVIKFAQDQAYIISDNGMMSYFDAKKVTSCVSGYDPAENTYYLTLTWTEKVENNTLTKRDTVGYSLDSSNWISRYTFIPDMYQHLGNEMFSYKIQSAAPFYLMWSHTNDTDGGRCVFYGEDSGYLSERYANEMFSIKLASKMSPSNVKHFKSISIEGKNKRIPFQTLNTLTPPNENNVSYVSRLETDLGHDCEVYKPVYREGDWFYSIRPSIKPATLKENSVFITDIGYVSNSGLVNIGVPTNQTLTTDTVNQQTIYLNTIFFNTRVTDLPVKIGDYLIFGQTDTKYRVRSLNNDGSITFETALQADHVLINSVSTSGHNLISPLSTGYGEQPRGHYAIITLYGRGRDHEESNLYKPATEVYCVNVLLADSKDHHVQSEE